MVLIVSGMGIAFVTAAGVNFVVGPPHVSSTFSQTTSSLASTSATSTFSTATLSSASADGSLSAGISIGPTQPVCYASATEGPAPPAYATVEAVVADAFGHTTAYQVNWTSNGCYVTGSLTAPLAPGNYSLNLTGCSWMGCKAALPKDFAIQQGQTTDVEVSIFTGIV